MSFYDLWENSDRPLKVLNENHSYSVGGEDSPTFERIEKFDAAMPNPTPSFEGPLPTEVGRDEDGKLIIENAVPHLPARGKYGNVCQGASLSPRRPERDEWKEWNKARRDLLLGGKRITRTGRGYTVFPADKKVNRDILGVANKYIQARINPETGLPCEEFRDLANHLATNGLRHFADGTVSTYYLEEEAHLYLRKQGSAASLSNQHLKPRTQK